MEKRRPLMWISMMGGRAEGMRTGLKTSIPELSECSHWVNTSLIVPTSSKNPPRLDVLEVVVLRHDQADFACGELFVVDHTLRLNDRGVWIQLQGQHLTTPPTCRQ